MSYSIRIPLGFVSVVAVYLSACGGGGSGDGQNPGSTNPSSAVVTAIIPPGAQCPNGGIQVDSGIDDNGNGVLDGPEVDNSEVVCNGTDGTSSLIAIENVEPGPSCANGGFLIKSGEDFNNNGFLDSGEVLAQEILCSSVTPPFDGLVYVADASLDNLHELYQANLGNNSSTKIFGPETILGEVFSFAVSPNRSKVAFVVKQDKSSSPNELYIDNLDDELPPKLIARSLGSSFGITQYEWSPNGFYLGYVTDQETVDVLELFAVLADGVGRVKVNGPLVANGDVGSFEWTSDSLRLVYQADQNTDNQFEVFASLTDGSGNTRITPILPATADVTRFTIAPDASRVAYLADINVDNFPDLFTVDLNGTNNVEVSTRTLLNQGQIRDFIWSPSGDRIAYRSDTLTQGTIQLLVVAADRAFGPSVITPSGGGLLPTVGYVWAPDGSAIAFDFNEAIGDNFFQLYVHHFAGAVGTLRVGSRLALRSQFDSLDSQDFFWKPDSTQIAFLGASAAFPTSFDVYRVAPDGTQLLKLNSLSNSNSTVEEFAWSPDGVRGSFIQTTNGVTDIYSVLPDGSGELKLNDTMVGSGGVKQFQWAPDSARIAYIANQDNTLIDELYSVLATQPGSTKMSGEILPAGGNVSQFSW